MATALFPLSLSPSLSPPSFPSLVSEEKYKKSLLRKEGGERLGRLCVNIPLYAKRRKTFLKKENCYVKELCNHIVRSISGESCGHQTRSRLSFLSKLNGGQVISPVFVGEEGEMTGRKREEKTRTKSLFLFFILFFPARL